MTTPTTRVVFTVTIDFTDPVEDLATVQSNVLDGLIEQVDSQGIAPDGVGEIACTRMITVAAPDTDLTPRQYNFFEPGKLQA